MEDFEKSGWKEYEIDGLITCRIAFIDKIGFKNQLSQTRANGLSSMIKEMKLYALAFQNK